MRIGNAIAGMQAEADASSIKSLDAPYRRKSTMIAANFPMEGIHIRREAVPWSGKWPLWTA